MQTPNYHHLAETTNWHYSLDFGRAHLHFLDLNIVTRNIDNIPRNLRAVIRSQTLN